MTHKKTQLKSNDDKVLLSKGTRSSKGHRYEIFIKGDKFFLIIANAIDLRSEMFEIDIKKFTILENAVDVHIEELGW